MRASIVIPIFVDSLTATVLSLGMIFPKNLHHVVVDVCAQSKSTLEILRETIFVKVQCFGII